MLLGFAEPTLGASVVVAKCISTLPSWAWPKAQHRFLTIGRVSKFIYARFRVDLGKMNCASFSRGVIDAFPKKVHAVFTDNGMSFADLPVHRRALRQAQAVYLDRQGKLHPGQSHLGAGRSK